MSAAASRSRRAMTSGGVGRAARQALRERLARRRQDEDAHALRHGRAHLLRALPVDLQHARRVLRELLPRRRRARCRRGCRRRARARETHRRATSRSNSGTRHEVILAAFLLGRAARARGVRDRQPQCGRRASSAFTSEVLPAPEGAAITNSRPRSWCANIAVRREVERACSARAARERLAAVAHGVLLRGGQLRRGARARLRPDEHRVVAEAAAAARRERDAALPGAVRHQRRGIVAAPRTQGDDAVVARLARSGAARPPAPRAGAARLSASLAPSPA